jgi:hypothetical protein
MKMAPSGAIGDGDWCWVSGIGVRNEVSQIIYQMVTDSEEGKFHSVRNAELVEDVGDVVLDRLGAERELLTNFVVAVAGDNRGGHLELSRAQAKALPSAFPLRASGIPPEQLNEVRNIFPTHPVLTLHDAANTLNYQLRSRFFKHNATRAQPEGLGYLTLIEGCCQNDGSRARVVSAEISQNFQSASSRHRKVQEHNVRFQFIYKSSDVNAIGSLAKYPKIACDSSNFRKP